MTLGPAPILAQASALIAAQTDGDLACHERLLCALARLDHRGPAEEKALAWAEQSSAALGSRIEVRALQENPE